MVRPAKIKDVPDMLKLINFFAQRGEMLARSLIQLYNDLRDFVVYEKDGKIIGLGSLVVIWSDLGEIRTLAVHQDYQRQGVGREIVKKLIQDAVELELPAIFTLTYQPGFFKKFGFIDVDKHDLPHKVWKDCINCPKFPDCDETSLILNFSS